jgi:hypothetical protein
MREGDIKAGIELWRIRQDYRSIEGEIPAVKNCKEFFDLVAVTIASFF